MKHSFSHFTTTDGRIIVIDVSTIAAVVYVPITEGSLIYLTGVNQPFEVTASIPDVLNEVAKAITEAKDVQ